MRKINNYKLCFSSFLLKSRKYVKGTISLFLALIVTPLLGMTLLMIESIRYQDAIEEMIEINDLASFATLGNYDPFLRERFGMLATTQDEEISALYQKYFCENLKMIDKDVLVESFKIDGEYSLDDLAIMEQQILEYSEFSAFFDTVFEGLNISEVLDELSKTLQADKFDAWATELGQSSRMCDAIAKASTTIIDAAKFIKEEYDPAVKDYLEAYDEFEEKVNAYIEVLNEYDEDDEDIYDEDDVKAAWKEVKSPLKKYKEACDDLSKKIGKLKGVIDDVAKSLTEAFGNYEKLQEVLNNEDKDSTMNIGFGFSMSIAKDLIPLMQAIATEEYETTFKDVQDSIDALSGKLKDLKDTSFTYKSSTDKTKSKFFVVIDDITSFVTAITHFKNNFEKLDPAVKEETAKDLINTIVTFLDVPCMIDGNCRAVIPHEKNLQIIIDENDASNAVGILAIAQLTDCIRVLTFPTDIIELIYTVVELTIAVTALVTALSMWITIATVHYAFILCHKPEEYLNHYLLCGYCAYNFPNRTNYMQKLDLTGYNYGIEIYKNVCGQDLSNPSYTDNHEAMSGISLVRMMDRLDAGESFFPTANSTTFYGAEQEYLLCGWKDEVYNQCGAFYNILMLRMLLNVPAIFADQNVAKEAKNAGPYAWIIYILVLLGDSFLDTFILANGGDICLVKFSCYLTSEGIKDLLTDLAGLSDCTTKLNEFLSMKSTMDNLGSEDNPFFNGVLPYTSYTDHMFILFMICTDHTKLLERVQNVVENESMAYYQKHKDESFEFDINKTYTYVHTEVAYKINPMFNFSSLTENEIVSNTTKLERHVGY